MPRLWMQEQHDDRQTWIPSPLDGEEQRNLGAGATLLKSRGRDGKDEWTLLAAGASAKKSSLRVNGEALPLGLRVLRDRDAVQWSGGGDGDGEACAVVFFSAESAAVIAPFAAERPIQCPRCRTAIVPGTPSVRCPRCHAVHHQSAGDEWTCWTHHSHCSSCRQQPTVLDDSAAWTPEEL